MGRTGADIKTKAPQIVEFWSQRIYEGDLGVDWCDAHERCWRCGEQRSIERCHIIPNQYPFCGADSPENFVLLCKLCHGEAPSCSDATQMWSWIRLTKADEYDTFRTKRDWEEMKRIHGLDVVGELSVRDHVACLSSYKEIFDNEVGLHLGQHPFSIASKVFVWRKVFSQISPRDAQTG